MKIIFNFTGELRHALDLSKPKFVFVSEPHMKKASTVCKDLKYVRNIMLLDGNRINDEFTLELAELIRRHKNSTFDVENYVSTRVDIQIQVAFIFCSSGTTGQPKGVEITQENILSCLQTYRGFMLHFENIHQSSIVVLNIAPWFHVSGFVSMFMYALSRNTVFIFLPKFEEILFYKTIEVIAKH